LDRRLAARLERRSLEVLPADRPSAHMPQQRQAAIGRGAPRQPSNILELLDDAGRDVLELPVTERASIAVRPLQLGPTNPADVVQPVLQRLTGTLRLEVVAPVNREQLTEGCRRVRSAR